MTRFGKTLCALSILCFGLGCGSDQEVGDIDLVGSVGQSTPVEQATFRIPLRHDAIYLIDFDSGLLATPADKPLHVDLIVEVTSEWGTVRTAVGVALAETMAELERAPPANLTFDAENRPFGMHDTLFVRTQEGNYYELGSVILERQSDHLLEFTAVLIGVASGH